MESNHHSSRRQGYSLLSSPLLSVRLESVKGQEVAGREAASSGGFRAVGNPPSRIPDLAPTAQVADRARTGAAGDHNPGCFRLHHDHHEAGTTGLEPAASRLTSECSARLSYAPKEVARVGFEPTVSSS